MFVECWPKNHDMLEGFDFYDPESGHVIDPTAIVGQRVAAVGLVCAVLPQLAELPPGVIRTEPLIRRGYVEFELDYPAA